MVWIEAKFMRMCQKNTKMFVRLLFRTPVAEIRTPVEKKSLFSRFSKQLRLLRKRYGFETLNEGKSYRVTSFG